MSQCSLNTRFECAFPQCIVQICITLAISSSQGRVFKDNIGLICNNFTMIFCMIPAKHSISRIRYIDIYITISHTQLSNIPLIPTTMSWGYWVEVSHQTNMLGRYHRGEIILILIFYYIPRMNQKICDSSAAVVHFTLCQPYWINPRWSPCESINARF